MALVRVGCAGMVPPGSSMTFNHDGRAILVANVGGTFCAIACSCPCAGADLSRGEIEDGTVTCPRHGARFDLRSGRNVGDAKKPLHRTRVADARAFRVMVAGDDVLVEVG